MDGWTEGMCSKHKGQKKRGEEVAHLEFPNENYKFNFIFFSFLELMGMGRSCVHVCAFKFLLIEVIKKEDKKIHNLKCKTFSQLRYKYVKNNQEFPDFSVLFSTCHLKLKFYTSVKILKY